MKDLKLPTWITKEDIYTPPYDKDSFINKSIYAMLSILSRFRSQEFNKNFFGVSASLQFACTFIFILLVTLSHKYSFVVIAGVYLLMALSLLNGNEIIKILRISFIVGLFSLIVLFPSTLLGNDYSMMMISAKILSTVTAANILSHTVPWHSLTGSMKRFFVPNLFIFVLDITLKYIFSLGEFSINMLYSIKVRSIGRNRNKYAALSGITGTMFIRSVEMSQEMYSAMECRGFTGKYRKDRKFKITVANIVYGIINGLLIYIFFYLRSYD